MGLGVLGGSDVESGSMTDSQTPERCGTGSQPTLEDIAHEIRGFGRREIEEELQASLALVHHLR